MKYVSFIAQVALLALGFILTFMFGVLRLAWGIVRFLLSALAFMMDVMSQSAEWIIKIGLAAAVLVGFGYGLTFFGNKTVQFQTVKSLPPLNMSEVALNDMQVHNPMIRLTKNGIFHCSGVVISDTYAVTAAHCVAGPDGMMDQTPFTILPSNPEELGTTQASAVAMLKTQDVALLKGDFRTFKKVPIETDPRGVLAHQGPFMACGFPGGGGAVCIPFNPVQNREFLIVGSGFLYQGMSGGPVMADGKLVAVNSSVSLSGVSVGPLIGFLAGAGVKVEQ